MLISNRQERSTDKTPHKTDQKPTMLDNYNSRDSERKQVRTQLLLQARRHLHHSQLGNEPFPQSEQAENQRRQQQTLQTSVLQLTAQLQKLSEINQNLIARIKQVETQYSSLRSELEKKQQDQCRKLKYSIYNDVENFIRDIVQRMAVSLKHERVPPALEQKIQRFMVEILQINVVAVEKEARRSRERAENTLRAHQHSPASKRQFLLNDLQPYRSSPDSQKYNSVMQRLTGQQHPLPPQPDRSNSKSKQSRSRFNYATTPQKRRRIFN